MAVLILVAVLALVTQTAFSHPLTFFKNPGPKQHVLNVVCPGSTMECPDGNTCCSNGNGGFGCCPKLHAVCCPDKKHCCPQGYTCENANGQCWKADSTHPLLELASSPVVTCPDQQKNCPNGDTCCKVSASDYGCCPKPEAVCCADMKHCCPKGYTCKVATGQCELGDLGHPLLELAIQQHGRQQVEELEEPEVKNVVCPGKSDDCPDGDTCCPIGDNKQGCCPHPNAVCCNEDHCCPQKYTCGSNGKKCTQGPLNHPLVEIVRPRKEQDVVCPDHQHECPNGQTCCKQGGDSYGCCPKLNAVCCSDEKHCCPAGYACSVDKCTQKSLHHVLMDYPLLKLHTSRDQPNTELLPRDPPVITCPDHANTCSLGSTCCQIDSGGYACCPKEQAVCCDHGKTCCPKGYTCDPSSEFCNSVDGNAPFLKIPAMSPS